MAKNEGNALTGFRAGDRVHNINFGYGTIRGRTNKGYWLVDWDERLIRKSAMWNIRTTALTGDAKYLTIHVTGFVKC